MVVITGLILRNDASVSSTIGERVALSLNHERADPASQLNLCAPRLSVQNSSLLVATALFPSGMDGRQEDNMYLPKWTSVTIVCFSVLSLNSAKFVFFLK